MGVSSIFVLEDILEKDDGLKKNIEKIFQINFSSPCQDDIQKIIKVINRYSYEGAIFNSIRQRHKNSFGNQLIKYINNKKSCVFCNQFDSTKIDLLGRIEKKHCSTCEVSKRYDQYHSLVVFKEHNPLQITLADIKDLFDLATEWFVGMNQKDPKAIFPMLVWNALWKSEKSLIHSHAHLLLGQTIPYAKVKQFSDINLRYSYENGGDYFSDFISIHRKLGLTIHDNSSFVSFSHLTPLRESEIIIISKEMGDELADEVYYILSSFIGKLNTERFSLGVLMPRIYSNDFPFFIRIVDRGNFDQNNDISGMDLFSSTQIISADPFIIKNLLINY